MNILNLMAVEETLLVLTQDPRAWIEAHGLNILFIISGSWLIGKIAIATVHGVLINAMKDHYFKSDIDRKKRADTLHGLISAIIRMVVFVVASAMIADEIGINTAPLLASAGVVGVALGIGAQSFIKDLVNGIFIISENQYRVGDVVDLEAGKPVSGTVESITMRTTILRDVTGTRHHVPNGSIVVASNKTIGFSSINLPVVVDQDTNIDKVTDIINKLGEELSKDEKIGPFIKQQLKMAHVGGFNGVGIELFVRGKTIPGKQWAVSSELNSRLQAELKKAKIKMPVVPIAPNKGA